METTQKKESQKHGEAVIRTYSVSRLGESLDRIATADAKTAESAIMTLRPKIAQMLESGACTISDVIIALQQGGMDLGRRQICKYLAAAGINKSLKAGAHGGAPARRRTARNAAPSGRGDAQGVHSDVHPNVHSDVHSPAVPDAPADVAHASAEDVRPASERGHVPAEDGAGIGAAGMHAGAADSQAASRSDGHGMHSDIGGNDVPSTLTPAEQAELAEFDGAGKDF